MSNKDKAAALFRQTTAKPATAHDRTAAAAREIVETEANRRADLTASLKAARLARDAGRDAPDGPPASDKKNI
ncbi:hypothetical protein [Celeribacter neptunius]|uniref:Uncharacterized protein n=1 Tax=Celeribacter neptunius TaxID=588602 RepID=A0A1I3UFX0_9RHOB|nr:hypothetical protein [Celeribacter neptunius]SFJ81569.1 hypothetical protein SAMN04487991_3024 [Celeribacter neptunius]